MGELIQLGGSGGTPSANNPDYYGGDIPFLSIADINGRDITNTAKTLTDEGLQNSAAWIVPSGAVSLAMYASVGKVGIIRQDTATSQAFYNMVFDNEALRDFVFTRLEKAETDSEWEPYISTGTQRNLNADKVKSFSLDVPSNEEASEISAYFANLDTLITLHQRKCQYRGLYGYLSWEQRKFSDLVLIERGGSPRPIDAYITEDPAGLNWVKIGDAPSMGRYITTTSEKIKPEGLSKTRQVYPGDLVLSNSMSFGRPYIMAVEGCIHDGWLLIRDTQNQFDPVFLCHMLGTPQMLDQYRMFASGSTVNNLNKELVGNAMVPLPDRDEQVKIGNYLDELDGLITLHQRMCPIFSFCAHGSRTNFAQTLQGWLQILRYPRPIPKMLVSPSAPASGVFGTAKGAFICASSSAGASTSSPSARKNFITSSTLCCRESLSSP